VIALEPWRPGRRTTNGASMRKVTAGLFSSIDGVVESPNLWQFDSFDAQMARGMTAMIERVETVVLGGVTYREWSGYWPNADAGDEFARFINPIDKHVATRTMTGPLDWQNSRRIDADLLDFVTELKAGSGGDIAVCGSISVVRQLLFAGLLDSLMLMMHPVIAGAGRHLFEPTDPTTRLRLDEAEFTEAGNAILSYSLRE
jgi:dihydrofolate reductase